MPRWVVEAQLCSVFLPALTGDCRAETAPCSPPGPRVRPWCCGGAPGLLVVLSLQGLRVGVRGSGGALVLRKCIVMVCRRFLVGSLFGWGGYFTSVPPPLHPPQPAQIAHPHLWKESFFPGLCPNGSEHSASPRTGGLHPPWQQPYTLWPCTPPYLTPWADPPVQLHPHPALCPGRSWGCGREDLSHGNAGSAPQRSTGQNPTHTVRPRSCVPLMWGSGEQNCSGTRSCGAAT